MEHARLTVRTTAVVGAAAVAGLFFAPVFGLVPLLVPVLVPAAAVLAVTLLCRRPALADWRPLLAVAAGALAVAETTLRSTTAAGLPTGRTLRALAAGVTGSWRLVLESTWPARPDPELLVLVPVLVVAAAVLGAELLLRLTSAPAALLPGLAVLVLGQLYAALPPAPAVAAVAAYAAVAAVALTRRGTVTGVAATAAAGVLVAAASLVLLPDRPPRWSLDDGRVVALTEALPRSPLAEIADRREHPDAEVFRVRGASGVDRWPLVVLAGFDGVSWAPPSEFRRFGRDLPVGPQVTVPAVRHRAELTVTGTGGPWLPSQTWPAAVDGAAPLIDTRTGSLLVPGSDGTATYTLDWWQPQVDATTLGDAAVDGTAPGGYDPIGDPPAGIEPLVAQAMRGLRPSFRSALLLEDFLRTRYTAAEGQNLPTGHGWPQLSDFLLRTRRGTSEQFAAAYVALARYAGIPARLAVGYRMPRRTEPDGTAIVRNADVLAWPEVAVRGVGWVPLDPSRGAVGATGGTGLAAQAERARDRLPPPESLTDPPSPQRPAAAAPAVRPAVPASWWTLLAVPVLPLAAWLAGVPAAWALRSRHRRRRPGIAGVTAAAAEVRDRLRAHGVPVTPGTTLRDLATATGPAAAGDPAGLAVAGDLERLARIVDRAVWSGGGATGDDVTAAWAAVRSVRHGLARRGLPARIRAQLDPRPLVPVSAYRSRRGSPSAR